MMPSKKKRNRQNSDCLSHQNSDDAPERPGFSRGIRKKHSMHYFSCQGIFLKNEAS